ncbi:MAG: ABC transporter permease subunit [Verrucomicrobiales bacterium]|nr:ABC transporter permease subunit [Verrucomicrobiales bacterium]
MTLPPLVERELRVSSRQRNTHRFRIAAGLIAVIVGAAFVSLTEVGAFPGAKASLGRGLFSVLSWIAFITALGSGPFLTSDSLSQERREGTLGLLFLTSLRGREIVLGKLLSTSLRSGYAMLAILPVLGVSLTLGGVGAAGFWKTVVALGTVLEVSLAAGLFCSAVSREAQKALGLTLVVLAALNLAGPAVDTFLQSNAAAPPRGRLFSPGYLFLIANSWGRVPFWTSLLANQVVAGVLLGLTCVVVRRTWREGGDPAGRFRFLRWPFGSRRAAASRSSSERRRLEDNPAYWLACRHGWLSRCLWALAGLLTAGTLVLVFVFGFDPGGPGVMLWMAIGSVWGLIALLLYLGTAMQAVRLPAEARRSGVLELLLTTPLSEARIVDGQWRGMLRMVGQPLILCLLMQLAGTFISQWVSEEVTRRQVAAMGTNAPPILIPGSTTNAATLPPGFPGAARSPEWISVLIAVLTTLTFAMNLAAIAWAGFWFGMVSRSANIATLKTLLYVQVIPAFIIGILSGLMIPILTFGTMTKSGGSYSAAQAQFLVAWLPLVLVSTQTLLGLAKDVGFIRWARRNLHAEFRQRATDALHPEVSAPPLISSPPVSSPPPLPPPVASAG